MTSRTATFYSLGRQAAPILCCWGCELTADDRSGRTLLNGVSTYVTRRPPTHFVACCCALVLAAVGCTPQKDVRVADFEPYVGGRPDPLRPVQPHPPRVVAKPPKAVPSGDAAWMPRRGITNRWTCVVVHHSGS